MKISNRSFTFWTVACLAAIFAHAPAQAQTKAGSPGPDFSKYKVLIGTGGETATYHTMVGKELAAQCATDDTFGFKPQDGGTTANIDDILGNKLDAGAGQEDSLFLKKASNPAVNGLKVLISLHPEEVHVFVRKNTGLFSQKTTMGISRQGDPIVFNSVEQTAGQTVVAWGGSHDTARLISANAGLNWNVLPRVKDLDAALAALNSGQAQVIVAVGGAPVGSFQNIKSPNVKMVGFGDATVTKLVSIYNGGALLNYGNLDAEGIKTISTNAVLFTREFSDPEMLNALAQFRACAASVVPALKDRRGMHPKWRQVNVLSKPKWQWYDLPAVAAAPVPARKK